MKYPESYADYNPPDSGITFAMGAWEGVGVPEVKVFPNGILIQTGESTAHGESMFADLITLWPEVGLSFSPDLVTETRFLSEVIVGSDIDLLRVNTQLDEAVSKFFPPRTGVAALHYFVRDAISEIGVRLERLVDASPERNEFFTQSTLRTADHLRMVADIERALLGS
jgi:hypothetical protein